MTRPLNILLVFDTLLRPDTTGIYVERAFRNLGHHVTHYKPIELRDHGVVIKDYSDLDPGRYDFVLFVDDDINYPVLRANVPRYYWCIDTHRMESLIYGGTRWDRLKEFDRVFLTQKNRADEVGGTWLPLAYDPAVWNSKDLEKEYDWCFIGTLSAVRRSFLDEVKERFPRSFVGNAYFKEANDIYNRSWLTLNLTFANDINMRFYEAQATSALLLSNRVHNGETSLFHAMEYFEDLADCLDKMQRFLDNKQICRSRASAQTADVANHTFESRMFSFLQSVGYRQ